MQLLLNSSPNSLISCVGGGYHDRGFGGGDRGYGGGGHGVSDRGGYRLDFSHFRFRLLVGSWGVRSPLSTHSRLLVQPFSFAFSYARGAVSGTFTDLSFPICSSLTTSPIALCSRGRGIGFQGGFGGGPNGPGTHGPSPGYGVPPTAQGYSAGYGGGVKRDYDGSDDRDQKRMRY